MIVTEDKLFNILRVRVWNAFKNLLFWRELGAIFFFGSMGFWLPFMFDWKGYDTAFSPNAVFTFGVATMAMVLEKRLFIEKDEDGRFYNFTKFFIFILTVLSLLAYFKGVQTAGEDTLYEKNVSFYWVISALTITFIAWFYNHINQSIYDGDSLLSSLGGDI